VLAIPEELQEAQAQGVAQEAKSLRNKLHRSVVQ